jgi:hypothetical protein
MAATEDAWPKAMEPLTRLRPAYAEASARLRRGKPVFAAEGHGC